MNLKDKVVVITGSSKGFGKELAKAFLKEGSKVVVNSSSRISTKKVAKELGIFGVCADVTKEKDLIKLSKKVIKEFRTIDIWINNAGLWMGDDLAENFDMTKVRQMFDVNIIGTMNGSRVALRLMKEKGEGTIINILSTAALAGRPALSAYCASKWAVDGFTKSIREENDNISVLAVYPGGMKTDLFNDSRPDDWGEFMEPNYVVDKVIENIKREIPENELVIRRS